MNENTRLSLVCKFPSWCHFALVFSTLFLRHFVCSTFFDWVCRETQCFLRPLSPLRIETRSEERTSAKLSLIETQKLGLPPFWDHMVISFVLRRSLFSKGAISSSLILFLSSYYFPPFPLFSIYFSPFFILFFLFLALQWLPVLTFVFASEWMCTLYMRLAL